MTSELWLRGDQLDRPDVVPVAIVQHPPLVAVELVDVAPGQPTQWLGAKLVADLGESARPRVETAVELLEAAVFVRNAGAHTQAAAQSIAALAKFGVAYPITDWGWAWQMIRAGVASAVWTLREELQAFLS